MRTCLPLACLFLLMVPVRSHAQFSRYLVKFTDKANNPYSINNPSQFLSQRALDRRARHGISINQADIPVTPGYIDSIRLSGNVTILNSSRWLNQVAIQTNDSAALDRISRFPFVSGLNPVAARAIHHGEKFPEATDLPPYSEARRIEGYYAYGRSGAQVNIHRGSFLHELGLRGQGIQLTVMDAGFYRYQNLPTFDSVRNSGRILGTWDFVQNEESVNEDHSHGMQCFSTIAANMPGIFVGSAPEASFYLFRTEDVNSEYPIEEHFWAVGAEKADSLGIDVISSSLGYSTFSDPAFDYSYQDMDGQTTMIAKAASIAAEKGMLVMVSAGNEGSNAWHYICTPADADKAVAVGAVDSLGRVANFSSYGPSSDGQIKPALASVGSRAVVASVSTGLPAFSSGTSFSCPNLAGLATCLWQGFPEMSNREIQEVMQQSANRANDPDDRIGYGIPDMQKAFVLCVRKTFEAVPPTITDCSIGHRFSVKCGSGMRIVIERKLAGENSFSEVFSQNGPDEFSLTDCLYDDDVTGQPAGTIHYRYRLDISADTSIYLDSLSSRLITTCEINGDEALVYQDPGDPEHIYVRFSTTRQDKANVQLFNAAGQRLKSFDLQQPAGVRTRSFSLAGLPRGVYVISVMWGNEKMTSRKFIKP